MRCPHCQEEIPLLACANCGQPALPGAKFCAMCGHELPPAPESDTPLLECESCGQPLLPGARFCSMCGHQLAPVAEDESLEAPEDTEGAWEGYDPNKRIACSDGMCIGIIGPDGRCTECGKPYRPESPGEED